MKKVLSIIMIFSVLQLHGQTEIFLSDSIQVAPELTYGSRAPRIALLADGNPIVHWGKTGSSPKMYVAKWEGNGFGGPTLINTNGIDVDLWGSGLGPQLATYGNTVFLVFETYGEGIWCVRSTDGGSNFENPVSVYELPQDRVATLPSVAIDNNGNPIVSFVTTNLLESEAVYEVSVSLDAGLTFEDAVVANLSASSGEVCECCPASMSITSTEEMLLTFRNNDNNVRDIWATKSMDGGENFTEATDLDDTDWQTFTCPRSGPHSMIAGDSLIAVYFTAGEGNPRVYLSTMHINSMMKGDQFKLPTFSGEEANQNFPRIAGNQDTLGVVWQESEGSLKSIILSYSVNNTSDLQNQLIKISGGTGTQRYPDIAFSNGVYHIIYEDISIGAVMYRQASFSPITAITTIQSNAFEISAKPNPFQTKTVVNFENSQSKLITAKLFDVNGKLFKSLKTSNAQIEIDGSNLNGGIYFLLIEKGDETSLIKLIHSD